MRALTTDQRSALAERVVARRIFIYCWPRHPDTGEPDPAGLWDDTGTVQIDDRTYYGSGTIAGVSTLSAKSDMTIPGLNITLSGVSQEVISLINSRTFSQVPIEVSIGIFDPESHNLIGPLVRQFVGVVDDIDGTHAASGGKGTVILKCESSSRALLIKGSDTRSSAVLKRRSPTDAFYDYTNAVADQSLYFGRAAP